MFVTTWMCAIAAIQRAEAYELLVKLCADALLSLFDAASGHEQSNMGETMSRAPHEVISDCALLLSEAIAYRNEYKVSTQLWGTKNLGVFQNSTIASVRPESLRTTLEPLITQCRNVY